MATGQDFDVDDEVAEAVLAHLASFAAAGPVEGLFGPAVEVGDGAPPSSKRWHSVVVTRGGARSGAFTVIVSLSAAVP